MPKDPNTEIDDMQPLRIEDYTQTKVPDKVRLSALLELAKGPDRNMKEFSKQCQTSPSTFSRILNMRINEPISKELISRIAENACNNVEQVGHLSADGTKKFFLQHLLDANGMMRIKDVEEERNKKTLPFEDVLERGNLQDLQSDPWNTIVFSLLKNEYGIKYAKQDNLPEEAVGYNLEQYNIMIEGCEPKYHSFVIADGYYPEEILMRDFRFLLGAAWEPKRFEYVKRTYVISDEELYKDTILYMRWKSVNTYISFILIDSKKHEIKEEWFVPRTDGKTTKSLFNNDESPHSNNLAHKKNEESKNPHGTVVKIPASKAPKFKAGKTLKDTKKK